MSTPPSTADICQGKGYVQFVPLAEVVRLQRDLFQETLHCCPRPAVRLLIVECAGQEGPVRRGICEGMVGVAIGDNLPIGNTGCAHLAFKGSNVVGRRERIVRAG